MLPSGNDERLERYAESALDRACQEIASAGLHARNDTLNRVTFGIGELVGGKVLDYRPAYNRLLATAIEAGLSQVEAQSTIRSGLAAGMKKPRVPQNSEGACSSSSNQKRPKAIQALPIEEKLIRPPANEVKALWDRAQRLTTPSRVDSFLESRGINPRDIGYLDVARALPEDGPFPKWWPSAWAKKWALIVQAFEPTGQTASIHARAINDVGDGPKTRWPVGYQAKGLLFADERGQALLRGTPIMLLNGVLYVEGITDFLQASIWVAIREARRCEGIAVFGITSGGASALSKISWPKDNLPAFIATDNDSVGDKYSDQIRQALPATMQVKRIHLGGTHE